MPKAKWTPPPDVAARLRATKEKQDLAAKLDAEVKAEIAALAEDGVPIAHLADTFDVGRKTIYRYTGRPMR